MKVLLLNPPGRRAYLRDYYCSKVSKASYLYHPTDLLVLSGIIAQRHETAVIDAIAEGLTEEKCLREISNWAPDAVVSLCGAVSFAEDKSIFRALKKAHPNLRTIITGDLVLEGATGIWEKEGSVDALLIDFTTGDLLKYLEGGRGEEIPNVIYRLEGRWIRGESRRPLGEDFEIPLPRYDLFPQKRYRYPFVRSRKFATVLTDYGCLHKCRFCVMGNLGYKTRTVPNVLQELEWLHDRGYREIYFNDQTFGLKRGRTVELLKAMVDRRFGFGWVCWSRVDMVDEAILRLMQAAGCHTIMFGAESGDEDVLAASQKEITPGRVREVLALCRRLGIRTVATFMIGLPGQDEASCLRTIDFACTCGCDFASFNLPVPRWSTELRREAIEGGWIDESNLSFDQSGEQPVMGNGLLSAEDIWRLRRLALRRFYLRPAYLARRLLAIRSLGELKALARFGWATLR